MPFDSALVTTAFGQTPLPNGTFVNSCLLASYGLAMRAALQTVNVHDFFDDYCHHFVLPPLPSSEQVFGVDHHQRIPQGGRGYDVVLQVHGGASGVFARARAATVAVCRRPLIGNAALVEQDLRSKKALALLSLSQTPANAHSVCVGWWNGEFYFVDPINAASVRCSGATVAQTISAFATFYGHSFSPDETILYEFV